MPQLNILIAEDDRILRLGLKLGLSKFGNIFEADSVESAKNIIASTPLDLTFTDLNLKDPWDGLEIVEASCAKGVYTIVLSGSDDRELIQKAFSLGCQDFYLKGKDTNNFEAIMAKFHSHRRI
jgi:YesN/AraC family two-component response regulator